MVRGFGESSSSSVGRRIDEFATLRGKRVPAAPSFGLSSRFHVPSAVRKCVTPIGGTRSAGAKPVLTSGGYVDFRLSRSSLSRMYASVRIPLNTFFRYQLVQSSLL